MVAAVAQLTLTISQQKALNVLSCQGDFEYELEPGPRGAVFVILHPRTIRQLWAITSRGRKDRL